MNISDMIEHIKIIQERANLAQTKNGFRIMTTCGRVLSALEELDKRIKEGTAIERARYEISSKYVSKPCKEVI